MSAPKLFLDIGDKMGAISHITSFWNYRFPAGAPRAAEAGELIAIFQDFSRGLAPTHCSAGATFKSIARCQRSRSFSWNLARCLPSQRLS